MKREILILLTCAFACSHPCVADPPTPPAAPPVIVWPDTIPTPPPPTPPTTTYTLGADELLVVTSNSELLAWSFPDGLLSIEKETGPVTIRGKFVSGTGRVQTKTFKAKCVLVITAAGTGRATLLVLPSGATSESQGVVRMVDCNLGPQPPPTPPSPPAPSDPLTAALQTAYNLDTDIDRAKSLAFLQAAYASMAVVVPSRQDITTNATGLAYLKSVIEAPGVGLTSTQIVNTRKAIAAELMKVFGTDGAAPLDRSSFAAELAKIQKALVGVH